MKNFYVIQWRPDFSRWVKTHHNSFTLVDAKKYALTINCSEVIHEMWLDCLEEWPEPNYLHAYARVPKGEHTI